MITTKRIFIASLFAASFEIVAFHARPAQAGPTDASVADFNGDGIVNGGDLSILTGHFDQPATPSQGDANGDGVASIEDYAVYAANFSYADFTAPTNVLSYLGPNAVSVTTSYVMDEVQTAANAAFTQNVQSYSVPAGNSPVVVPMNLNLNANNGAVYMRFGLAVKVTGDPNPEYQSAWDLANQSTGQPAMPKNLGLASLGYTVPSTDVSGAMLQPVAGSPSATGAVSSLPVGSSFFQGSIAGGQVGIGGTYNYPLSVANDIGFWLFGGTGQGQFNSLGNFAESSPTTVFTDLTYKAVTPGMITLSPTLDLNGTDLWSETILGALDADGDPIGAGPSFLGQTYSDYNYLNNAIPQIQIDITAVPEPASTGLIMASGIGLLARRRRKIN